MSPGHARVEPWEIIGDIPNAGHKRIPGATYRLQFHRGFTFRDALGQLEYLDSLGVTDLYASPLFQARRDSTHGYDVCDFNRLNPQLGPETDFHALSETLRRRGMGLLLDIVPNHMGIGDPANEWWTDVLEHGQRSAFAPFFDIDWQPLHPAGRGKVLQPLLGDRFERVLRGGEVRICFEQGQWFVRYHGHQLPLAPETWADLLGRVRLVAPLPEELGPALTGIAERCRASGASASRALFAEAKAQLAALTERQPGFRDLLERMVDEINGPPGELRGRPDLGALLEAQHYQLACWRADRRRLNYRCFFDVADLIGLRMELPEVFARCHQLVFRLLSEGHVTGLRIDHPDGLWDPAHYLDRLQKSPAEPKMPPPDSGATQHSCYVVVEKILSQNEELPADWAMDGTTGYDFLNELNGIFVEERAGPALERIYAEFTGERRTFEEVAYQCKRAVLQTSLAGGVESLARRLSALTTQKPDLHGDAESQWKETICEVLAAMPVYRTYLTSRQSLSSSSAADRRFINEAIATARSRNPRLNPDALTFLAATLMMERASVLDGAERDALVRFALRFQQLSPAVMAKGVEDTAFYVYTPLLSLNEIGGRPDRFGSSVEAFHRQNSLRQQRWPHALLATATHDTKRGEDVRARLNALSELPEAWERALRSWRTLNAGKKTAVEGTPAPDENDEYLIYQTLLGAFPGEGEDAAARTVFCARLKAYALKAVREAKRKTSWIHPHDGYEAALSRFVEGLVMPPEADVFLEAFLPLQKQVEYFGRHNSLAQVLLKTASPGVPDFYQGTELWDLSLVDPDNRRAVDFTARRRILTELQTLCRVSGSGRAAQEVLRHDADGRIKLYVTWASLCLRRKHLRLFTEGSYGPLESSGAKARHVCAFERALGAQSILAVAPRLVVSLCGGQLQPPTGQDLWQDTALFLAFPRAEKTYRNWFTGEECKPKRVGNRSLLPLSDVLRSFPVALLEST